MAGETRRARRRSAASAAKAPAAAAGAAVGGLAIGTVVGAALRARRRPHLLGLPLPRSREVRDGARGVAQAGRRLYQLESDVHALRVQADSARRQSPIEVVLSALTSRRLPRKT
jgi:hypothetical protein